MKGLDQPAPFERFYDLSDLSNAGDEIVIDLDADARAKLTAWADIDAVERFVGRITLSRFAPNRFGYEAELSADVVQSCVVTLAPVPSHIALHFSRTLHLMQYGKHGAPPPHRGTVTVSVDDEDGPEEIESSHYDLAGPLLEEFSLALDPYPRAPGVVFDAPEDSRERPESPFAVLGKLKGNDG